MATRSGSTASLNASSGSVLTGCADIEYFWAIELTSDKPTASWTTHDDDLEEDDDDFIAHTLSLRMAVLGPGAVQDEMNVVAMESTNEEGEIVKGVIVNLTRGENSMGMMNLKVDGKSGAKFTLLEGSGPVCISGNHLLDYPRPDMLDESQTASEGSDDDLGEDEEVDDEEDSEEEMKPSKGKNKAGAKRKVTPKNEKPNSKKAKMEPQDDDDDDDDEEDEDDVDYDMDDDDDESEEEKTKKKEKKNVPAKETQKSNDKKGKANGAKENGKKASAKKGKK